MKIDLLKSALKSVLGLNQKTHLHAGQPAPALDVTDEAGTVWTLDATRGQPFILYFYPMDDTPGCTKESCSFRDAAPGLGALGVRVLGASMDSTGSHTAFKQKYNLNFPLLVDTDGALAARWGVRDGAVARRATFLVDKDGVVRQVWDPVSVGGHSQAVAVALQAL
ncbi:MAG: peroxiredoxin [Myxococcales bacterium]|nr:peroxiredoxin [Myxococcales bacterium]